MKVEFDFGQALVPSHGLRSDRDGRADGVPRDARCDQVEECPATHEGSDYSFKPLRIAFTGRPQTYNNNVLKYI